MEDDFILCIDKGTTELKTILFSSDGQIIAQTKRECRLSFPKRDWVEEDTQTVWQQVTDAVKGLLGGAGINRKRIKCIGITSHMSGTIFVDEAGETVGNAVMWNDSRTNEMIKEWEARGVIEKTFDISGSRILPGWTVPLVAWWKQNHPEILEKSKYVLSMKDWIRFKLTGEIWTDHTEATCSPGDIIKKTYSPSIFKWFGIEEWAHLFPPVQDPLEPAGRLIPSIAEELGLDANTKVITGMGDMPASVLGSGSIRPGHGASTLGTTFLNGVVTDRPYFTPRNIGMTNTYIGDMLVRLVNNTGGGAINYQWLLNIWRSNNPDHAESVENILADLNARVARCPVGANGVMYHPYINSAGITAPFYNLGARAQFTGISLHNTYDDLLRAVFEGLGFAMKDCYSSVPIPLERISVTGGGGKSEVLCQILADCCDAEIIVPKVTESAALGTAIIAAVGTGMYGNYEEAVSNMVHIKRKFEPNARHRAKYDELFQRYKDIRRAMMPIWDTYTNPD